MKMLTAREITKQITECFIDGGKLIWLGNGGSMAESSHASAEFTGLGLPSIALSDLSTITALSNDFGYDNVFAKWIDSIYKPYDLIIGISSSGKSFNVNNAFAFCDLKHLAWIDFPRKGKTTSEVQNNQLKMIHKIYENFKGGVK